MFILKFSLYDLVTQIKKLEEQNKNCCCRSNLGWTFLITFLNNIKKCTVLFLLCISIIKIKPHYFTYTITGGALHSPNELPNKFCLIKIIKKNYNSFKHSAYVSNYSLTKSSKNFQNDFRINNNNNNNAKKICICIHNELDKYM